MIVWGAGAGMQAIATAVLASILFIRHQRLSRLYDADDFRRSPFLVVIGAALAIREGADD
jgi:hypothetical protein